MYMRHFHHLFQAIQSFNQLYQIFSRGQCHLLSTEKTQITPGVEITKWKELTFFLPSQLKTFSSNDFSPFPVQFLGARIDHGELPHNIFQANTFKSALGAMLKIIDDLSICPGVYDPFLVDMAESKSKCLLYLYSQKEQS